MLCWASGLLASVALSTLSMSLLLSAVLPENLREGHTVVMSATGWLVVLVACAGAALLAVVEQRAGNGR